MHVLLVDDDEIHTQAVSSMLDRAGWTVEHSQSGKRAFALSPRNGFDIVLVELILSDMDGYEFVRRMRASGDDTPILILSALTRPAAKVKALELGADDFITRPFDPSELLARMQAFARRRGGFSHALHVGSTELNRANQSLTVAERMVHLTGKECQILELLMLRKGIVQSKQTLRDHLYGGAAEPETKTLDVFVSNLRKKLTRVGSASRITTVWGRGYMIDDPAVC
jgi:two-component system cell cycle response regulator CtrA